MMRRLCLPALALALALDAGTSAEAGLLANYQVSSVYSLDTLGGMGLEGSAITYARDRGTLFFVGDEGLGVVEISRTGQTLSTMTFSGWPAASTNHDAEGLTYLGNGVLVVAEERLQDALRFTYSAGGSVDLANAGFASIGGNAGNNGTEGISYDPRGSGSFVSVKQQGPQAVLGGTLSFAPPPGGGTSTMVPLFDPTLLGLATLSDIQTLSGVDALLGTPQADNLLILSLGSNMLVEATRQGAIVSSFNLAGIVPNNAIEGVTIDENGIIYLIAEHEQDGSTNDPHSRLIALTPVPEPSSVALLAAAGVTLAGYWGRRRWRAGAV